MDKQFVVKPEKCLGCGLCEQVCSYVKTKEIIPGRSAVTVMTFDEDVFAIPLMCRQCDEAPCVKICPVGALERGDDVIVTYSEEKCIVCRLCAEACPMGNMSYCSVTRKMSKCDRCEGDPKCESFCPSEAISITSEDPYLDRKQVVAETIRTVYRADWKDEAAQLYKNQAN